MDRLFGSELWHPALEKYAQVTGLTVRLFAPDATVALATVHPTALFALFEEFEFEPGLFSECAQRCLDQTTTRPAVTVQERHGLTVVGTSLVLEGAVVGAAVVGYALASFSSVAAVHRWAKVAGLPFARLWPILRAQPPVPERRLRLYGELLQVLGDALLRENRRTRQYEEAAKELKAANAAKDEFLAVLSHELRTPLAGILGWVNVLQKDARPELVARATSAIERNVALQTRMVDDLLDLNRIARGELRLDVAIHDLSALVRSAVEMNTLDIEAKAIKLTLVDAGEPLFVAADSGRLQQVLRNIVSNAVKFTPRAGRVHVAIARDGESARIAISDTGVGIGPEFLPFVFDMFRQQEEGTRRRSSGLGIGLALVKRLIDLHQGTVNVASAGAGQGTEVTVQLPLAEAASELCRVASAGPRRSPSTLAGTSILVVEDTEDSRETLRILLEQEGAKVRVARDGREALEVLRTTRPDIVLCDLRMPRMDGYEFMRELAHHEPAPPPVVAMSALVSDADRRNAMNAGFASHIKKPFDEATVLEALGDALGKT